MFNWYPNEGEKRTFQMRFVYVCVCLFVHPIFCLSACVSYHNNLYVAIIEFLDFSGKFFANLVGEYFWRFEAKLFGGDFWKKWVKKDPNSGLTKVFGKSFGRKRKFFQFLW